MIFRTHLFSGLFFFSILLVYSPASLTFSFLSPLPFSSFLSGVLSLFLCLFFAVLPDIDLYSSKLGKRFWFLSFLLYSLFGHRGIIHSLWPFFLIYFFFTHPAVFCYVIHLVLDALTKKGISFFWPFLKIKGIFQTRGLVDHVLSFLFLVLSLPLLIYGLLFSF